MDDSVVYRGLIEPRNGRRRLVAQRADGEPYELHAAVAPAWGYEGDAPRQAAAALLIDLTGQPPLSHQVWDLVCEWIGNDRLCPPRGEWAVRADDLDAWRRGWFKRPERRLVVERAFVGSMLRAPEDVQIDLTSLADRRDREVVQRLVDGIRSGVLPGLDELQAAVDELRLGAEPGFVHDRLAAAPDGPGPHVWAARLQASRAIIGWP